MSHYQTLSLPPTANSDEIKRAYRKLSLETHPDLHNACPVKAERFKQISEAYAVLGSESERRRYDLELKEGSFRFRGSNAARHAKNANAGGASFGIMLPRNVLIGSLLGLGVATLYNTLQSKQKTPMEEVGKSKLVEAYWNNRTKRYEKPRPWEEEFRREKPEIVLVERERVFDRR